VRIVRLAIQRYRSIIETERFPLGEFTVLVGPNNEGKSNILQALVTSMTALTSGGVGERRLPPPSARRRPGGARASGLYDWERDFPQALQETNPQGTSVFNLDFELGPEEIREFETAVGSRLNGILPVQLAFGPESYTFSVRKQKVSAALTAKRREIEQFIAGHVHLEYIPATRTSEAAQEVVEGMIAREFRRLEQTPEYLEAVMSMRDLQRPILDKLQEALCGSVQQILPAVTSVRLDVREDVFRRMARNVRITVDDGTATELEFKGDGMQSLAALSLIRHYSEEGARGRELILAVEEPEAHLHPGAVHEIASVLRATAATQHIVISTHSPLLVNRFDLGSNLIVQQTKARSARSVRELRDVLGVKTSDNLENADIILIVEGDVDRRSLVPVLSSRSTKLRAALSEGTLSVRPLHGGGKLAYVLRELRDSMCRAVTLVDDDQQGRQAAAKAREEGLLELKDEFFATFPGASESELEDLFRVELYEQSLSEQLGVQMDQFRAVPRSRGKWSARMKLLFENQGKRWDDEVEGSAKDVVAASVAVAPDDAVDPNCEALFDNLVAALESRLVPSTR
jgi:energy-coupling factor transporter ATP-binding protein EcfA2